MWLDNTTFRQVVSSTPLISIDLVIENPLGQILLGQRVNPPAQSFWFVPGGRIQKNETLDHAYTRLTQAELGCALLRQQFDFLGVYEHLYPDSIFTDAMPAISTHYVVLAYYLRLDESALQHLPTEQHSDYRWWSKTDIQNSALVHANTRAYLPALTAPYGSA